MFFAAAVTATTTIAEFIDEITLLARPLERIGLVQANDVGLAVGLVVRFVPEILGRYQAIKEAHAARGIKVRPVTLLAPLIILTLRDADNIAAAIDARGIRRHVS
jgi:biotin transport system permease protein